MGRGQARDFAVPPPLAPHVAAALDEPVTEDEAPPARPAATVLLVRDGTSGVQVFMLRRAASMAFAPSSWVFPGGGVDPRDAEPRLPWAGPSPQEWAERMAVSTDRARELVTAAAREVFEECGVLLAGPDAQHVIADVRDQQWRDERAALLAKEQSLAQLLLRRGLVLRADLLTWCDHWVTPTFEPRRYDTHFFAALVPPGQRPDDETSEADVACWVDPDELLEQTRAGQARMLPPTVVNVERVAGAADAAGLVQGRPSVLRVMPRAVRTPAGAVLRAWLPKD